MERQILVLNAPAGELDELSGLLSELPGAVLTKVRTRAQLFARLGEEPPVELVVIDVDVADGQADGLSLLRELRAQSDDLALIAVAARGSVDGALRAIEAGASDFLVRGEHLRERWQRLQAQVRRTRGGADEGD